MDVRRCGVGRTTLWRWTRDPDFVLELQRRRQDRRELVQTALVDSALQAVAVLHEVMTDKEVNPAVRVKAAETLLARAGIEEIMRVVWVFLTRLLGAVCHLQAGQPRNRIRC